MLNSQLQRLLVVGAVTFIVLLFSSSQAEAGSRTFRAWTRLMVSFEQVCKDGIRFGMADSDPYTYKVEVRKKGESVSLPPRGVASGLSLESRTNEDDTFTNRYCNPAPVNPNSDSFVMLYCRGAYSMTWNPPLNVDDEIDLYVYKRNTSGTYSSYDFNVFPLKPLPDQGFQSLRVSDCNVNDLTVAVAQAGPDSDAATVTDALVFEVRANDPNWGPDNGDGIQQVDMSILAANGAVIYARSQTTPNSSLPPVYCAFGSAYYCRAWVFQDKNNLWPNGQPIQNGAHTLQVMVIGYDGNTKTITKAIDIQLQPPDTTTPPPLPLQIPTLPAVAAGGAHTCAVTTAGKVYCWGGNAFGQLGTGDKVDRQTPTAIPDLAGSARAVSAGGNHTCVLLTSGEMRCYGADGAVSLAGIAAISSGDGHSCALTATGGVKCWGENGTGQLGNGTYTFSTTPVDVQGLASSVVAISAGSSHTCALINNGGVKCWGYNVYGQLGNGTFEASNTPKDVFGVARGAVEIAAGFLHTCIRTEGGEVRCWGANDAGQLGSDVNTYRSLPAPVPGLAGVDAIEAGDAHTCALVDGGVKCWGDNSDGQVGDGAQANRNAPVDVQGLANGVRSISAGGRHTCAITTDNALYCWGGNQNGQLGNGLNGVNLLPTDVSGLTSGVVGIDAGANHTCAALSDGSAKCWGQNANGKLGNGTQSNSMFPAQVRQLTMSAAIPSISAGGGFTCARASNGGVKCWGQNNSGQLGIPSREDSALPDEVQRAGSPIAHASAGRSHACVVTGSGGSSTGGVKCWGWNSSGQIGNGSFTDGGVAPVDVSGLTSGVYSVSAGEYHTCALRAGRLNVNYINCWGNNDFGSLGNGTTTDSNTPTTVSGLTSNVIGMSAGAYHTCALMDGGAARCWGLNDSGQLGNGARVNSSVPVNVQGLASGVNAISAGSSHTCALMSSGGVKCWGWNGSGQLGNGTTISSSVPVDVPGLTGVRAISAGADYTCALTSANGLKCWGANTFGQLGNGMNASTTAQQVVLTLNQTPTASDQALTTTEDTPLPIPLTASDPDGTALILTVISPPAYGVLIDAMPAVTYQPNPDFHGADSFVYQVEDGYGGVATATVSLTITPVNDPPNTAPDTFSVAPNSTDNPLDVLANDADVDGDALTIVVASAPSQGGAVSIVPGAFSYTPLAGFEGVETFTYTIDDGNGGSAEGSVSISVLAVPGPGQGAVYLPIVQN